MGGGARERGGRSSAAQTLRSAATWALCLPKRGWWQGERCRCVAGALPWVGTAGDARRRCQPAACIAVRPCAPGPYNNLCYRGAAGAGGAGPDQGLCCGGRWQLRQVRGLCTQQTSPSQPAQLLVPACCCMYPDRQGRGEGAASSPGAASLPCACCPCPDPLWVPILVGAGA